MSLFGDARRYGQFILNFLTNSIKFTPVDGEVTVHLNILSTKDIKQKPERKVSQCLDESNLSESILVSSIGDDDDLSDSAVEEITEKIVKF